MTGSWRQRWRLAALAVAVAGCGSAASAPVPAGPVAPRGPAAPDAHPAAPKAAPSPSAAPSSPEQGPASGETPSATDSTAKPKPAAEPEPAPAPVTPPRVEVTEPSFVGPGQVPKIDKILDKTRADVAKCIAQHGGLTATDAAHLKVQLLVRDRGRAEGVEVLEAHGVGDSAAKCVRELLEGKWVGAPTADPAGVMFRYELAPGN